MDVRSLSCLSFLSHSFCLVFIWYDKFDLHPQKGREIWTGKRSMGEKKKGTSPSLSLSLCVPIEGRVRARGRGHRMMGTLAPRSEAPWLVDAVIITVIRKEIGRRIMAVDFCMLENSPNPLPLPLSPHYILIPHTFQIPNHSR